MERKYRQNVAIVVFNKDKKLLLCERAGKFNDAWQFPQGGIDEGETPKDAAFRELFEETSIKSVDLIKILERPIRYHFPINIRRKLWHNKNNQKFWGQDQYWVLFYFKGNDSEINLQTATPEFKNYKWDSAEFAIENIVGFKKGTYRKALSILQKYINKFKVKHNEQQ